MASYTLCLALEILQIAFLLQNCYGVENIARIKRSTCDQATCPTGSRCVIDSTGGHTCQCYRGYVPPTCKDRNECLKAPTLCQNGTCINTPGSFKCDCTDGYSGPRCNFDVDECQSNPCLNNNTCVNTQGSYHCRCYNGYMPPDCQDRDECGIVRGLCNHGTCINTPGSFRCNCYRGYTGSRCKDSDPCAMQPCQNGGTCVPSQDGNSYTCKCYVGFNRSSNCDDVDECTMSSSPCFHGKCVNNVGSFACTCANGYTGSHCKSQIDFCLSSPCINGGSCLSRQNGYACNCFEGFNNTANCIDIDECKLDAHTCHNGSCINTLGSFHCDCNHGYQGHVCSVDTDECQSHPCVYGSCVNSPGSYGCSCFSGYSGKTCSEMDASSSTTSGVGEATHSSRPLTTFTYSTIGVHSKLTTIQTSSVTSTHQNGISGYAADSSNTPTKGWIPGHYWVIIVVVLFVVGFGVGAVTWRLKSRFENKSPSSPSSATMSPNNSGILSFENHIYGESSTDVLPCSPNTSAFAYDNHIYGESNSDDLPRTKFPSGVNPHSADTSSTQVNNDGIFKNDSFSGHEAGESEI